MKNRIKKSKAGNRAPVNRAADESHHQKRHEITLSGPDGVAICYTEVDPDQVRAFLKFAKLAQLDPGSALWEAFQRLIEWSNARKRPMKAWTLERRYKASQRRKGIKTTAVNIDKWKPELVAHLEQKCEALQISPSELCERLLLKANGQDRKAVAA